MGVSVLTMVGTPPLVVAIFEAEDPIPDINKRPSESVA